MRFLEKPAFECFILVLWNVWNDRNNLLFKGCMDEPKTVWNRAVQFCQDFRIHNLFNAAMCPKQVKYHKWSKPPQCF